MCIVIYSSIIKLAECVTIYINIYIYPQPLMSKKIFVTNEYFIHFETSAFQFYSGNCIELAHKNNFTDERI